MAFFLRTAFAARIATQSTKSSSIPRLQQLPAFRTGNSVRFYRPSQPLVQQKPPVTYYRFGGNNSNNSSGGKRSGFGGTGNVFQRWTARPTFYYEVGGIGLVAGGFYVYNLEPVPVSGRRRFNVISPKYERQMGEETYNQVIEQYRGRILPQNHSDVLLVKRVLARLLSGLAKLEASDETDQSPHNAAVSAGGAGGGWREGLDGWEVNVIRGEEANAFVLPGNKVFVFTGILPLMQDDSGVASVLSHEIAHNIAHHAAERMSNTVAIYYPFIAIVSVFLFISGADFGATNWLLRTVVDVGLEKPGSRRQESEADYIGLSKTTYNQSNNQLN